MDLEYDRKFEEMKKYIPFLESMIKRLESTNNGVKNPRKAQLDKIRSLRDLLLDKKKRMKMENLLKCEQVLVNLYAKVEQRDSMAHIKEDTTEQNQKDKSDLSTVRSKLKSVVLKLNDEVPETLPEIARATNTEVVCTPGSKEPALFQRRPNKASPIRHLPTTHNEDNSSSSKRNYTRVLMSPEHKKKDWLPSSDTNTDKPLFSRRSPRRSPRKNSPSYKKERKKSSKQRSKSSQQSKDLNITLQVPEESLGSLNTKDILSRIINCNDNDVDIDTLRGLRSQILGELKQTATKDDISDLILKSYKKKEKRSKKKDEVEEGELSDSESEAIENIYGSLVVVEQGEGNSNINKISSDKKQPRKIQICLVINSDKEKDSKVNDQMTILDITDFETYTDTKTAGKSSSEITEDKTIKESTIKEIDEIKKNKSVEETKSPVKAAELSCKSMKAITKQDNLQNSSEDQLKISSTDAFKPNFYQPSTEEIKNVEEQLSCKSSDESILKEKDEATENPVNVTKNIQTTNSSAKARPKTDVVSEIDILQALKKEILGETAIVPMSEEVTPPLHQPKIMKVASAQEIVSKKRISIENYKQKSIPSVTQPLYNSVKRQTSSKDDNAKKQSLKLTEKECERFNFPVTVSPVDSSEDEDKKSWDFEFLHEAPKSPNVKNNDSNSWDFEFLHRDSAPKSPDHEDFADTGIKPPVIIPSDPVKNIVQSAKADIDMRTLVPSISSITLDGNRLSSPSYTSDKDLDGTRNEKDNNNEKVKRSTSEHQITLESNQTKAKNNPNSYIHDTERVSRPSTSFPNISPLMSLNVSTSMTPAQNAISNMNPLMTPILNPNMPLIMNPNVAPNMTPTMMPNMTPTMMPNMTPTMMPNINPSMTPNRMIPNINSMMTPILTPNARSYDMTPRPNFDVDDYTNTKHVYAPMFPAFEPHDFSETDSRPLKQSNESTQWEDRSHRPMSGQLDVDHRIRNDRFKSDKRLDSPYNRIECPSTPNTSFGRMDCPSTPNPSFGRMDCPPTPNPSFGRMDCPPTPNPSFGRMDCPSTPNPSFGRMDCPLTPNASFGRMETPMTPVHSFGRSDCPMTSNHHRSETNMMQTNMFGRSDHHKNSPNFGPIYMASQDPRLNRSFDYDKCHTHNDERRRSHYEDDRNIDNDNRYRKNQVKSYEQNSRNSIERTPRRESSVGRSLSRDYEPGLSYKKDNYNNDYQYRRDKYKYTDDVNNRRRYRARSTGRTNTSEDNFPTNRGRGFERGYTRESSIEKPISVQSHSGRTFNIDTSFNRTFQETKSPLLSTPFDVRRQRASSVGRSLRDSPLRDTIRTSRNKNDFDMVNVSDRKTMQFRRACSVGRDLGDYGSNKNFKDIKEDLRSCKFNNYHFDLHNRDHKIKSRRGYSIEKISSNECHNSRNSDTTFVKSTGHQSNCSPRRRERGFDSNLNKIDETFKYSPRKNIRDPRMRREIDIRNTNKEKYKDMDRNASSSRFKNYGIVYSNDNIAKGKILASAAGVKNFKIPKIKRAIVEKEIETQNESDGKKETLCKIALDGNKMETKSTVSDNKVANKHSDTKNLRKDIAVKPDKSKTKNNITALNKTSGDLQSQHENICSMISDDCEKRVTRSAIKGSPCKETSKTSLVKKLKRIKKPLVYDSDSDTEENISSNKNSTKYSDCNKNSLGSEILKNDVVFDIGKTIQSSDKIKDNKEDRIESTDCTNEKVAINITGDKYTLDNMKKQPKLDAKNESCEEHNDSLDISFGGDDEPFSDNIVTESDTVLDNINALIAGLDQDIEAPKINDFNDKFINNIVGSNSSDALSSAVNQTDVVSDITINDKNGFVDDVQNSKYNNAEATFSKDNTHTINMNKHENDAYDDALTLTDQILSNQNKSKDIVNKDVKDIGQTITQHNVKMDVQDKTVNRIVEIKEVINNADSIVSTTAYDGKSDNNSNNLQPQTNNIFQPNIVSAPDSTNNSNENNITVNEKELQESIPDSTNELTSEMNITSTQNSNSLSKEQSEANSTSADYIPHLDSMGNFLSILEDKNKIKEWLSLLSNDSSENIRIKKKLEKLSEIVSDDEENSSNARTDTNQKENLVKTDNDNCNHTMAAERICETIDKNKSMVDNTKVSDGNLVISGIIQNDNVILSKGEGIQNSEMNTSENEKVNNGIQEEQENTHFNKHLQKSILLPDNKNINENCVQLIDTCADKIEKITNSSIDKESAQIITENREDVVSTAQHEEQIMDEDKKENEFNTVPVPIISGKKITRKSKITKRGRSKLAKKLLLYKEKRVTRSESGLSHPQTLPVPKKPSRELIKLQEDIRDMFISEDVLKSTGIRMCRLAKLVEDNNSKCDTPTTESEPEPVVLLENIKSKIVSDESTNTMDKTYKKKTSKSKPDIHNEHSDSESKGKTKYKPGPKSKTKKQDDPYIFETESVAESNNTGDSIEQNTDSDCDSVSTKSFESSELLVDLKKKGKRKRGSWQLGVIKKKTVKTKSVAKITELSIPATQQVETQETKDKNTYEIPDINCFTDKSYCFHKNVKNYLCRLCGYRGNDIVPHYKNLHPHSEIPLSRLNPGIAKEAIEQCENMNLQAISKIQSVNYVCRFCFQQFHKQNNALETFFWHIVSVHTGEYKHICSECVNVTRCPFHLDIPPPPKNLKGQLIGYICGRCNFTQVSLENLKTHVIVRHDDEQTEVYSINLSEIPRKVLQSLVRKANYSSNEGLRVLRSTRSNQSSSEPGDEHSDITDSTDRNIGQDSGQDNIIRDIALEPPEAPPINKIQSNVIFENDDNSEVSSCSKTDEVIKASIKLERDEETQASRHNDEVDEAVEPTKEPVPDLGVPSEKNNETDVVQTALTLPTDVLDYPHFKIKLTDTGTKEYICCINGSDNHYKTTLLISFKKHVQLKHSENWDGYCFVCKVIVTSQGKHSFKNCLEHFLDKHIDNFPVFEEETFESIDRDVPEIANPPAIVDASVSKPYINVRPLSELISSEQSETEIDNTPMPKIQSVVSLGASDDAIQSQKDEIVYNYESAQSEVRAKKHLVVLEAMSSHKKLIQVFKCAGRFCSYTTDNAEESLLHASTHQRIGGEGSLNCAYCDFDCSGNAIDLVMHVFKNYNHCAFACSKCFYRAAASQLVYAHIKRMHPECDADKVLVLSSTTVVKDNSPDNLMSRDEAVLHYVCKNRDPDEGGVCQFKSYVLTKFREHQQMRHANDQEYFCCMCDMSATSSKLLAQHLKSHGLRIYQCCRCLFGADNESELVAHASEKHPTKQPKAYLRIITSKGGSSEVRVLPLAVLSKSSVETTVVSPSVDKESPVKQAERSIDLEKLIGQTNQMIESMHTITNAATIEPINVTANENSQVQAGESAPALLTLLSEPNTLNNPSVIVKMENVGTEIPPVASTSTLTDPDVVCLDSDEDTLHQNIIDLSDDDISEELNTNKKQYVKVTRARLYKCPKCLVVLKSEGMFKRHIISCFINPNELIKCAFCSYNTAGNKMITHYINDHLETNVPYCCAKCNGKFVSVAVAKKHMKYIHKETMSMITTKMSSTGTIQYVVDSEVRERQTPKRKLSSEPNNRNSEPATKLKKYGPQDVDKLPINPILEDFVYCSICEFNTKVRLNMVRHLQQHAEQQPVARTAPVNPVPHLESNEKHFDKMLNLASSSITTSNRTPKESGTVAEHLSPEAAAMYPKYVPDKHRYTCGAKGCSYISVNESMFKIHWETLHAGTNDYHCVHCPPHQHLDTTKPLTAVRIIAHLKMHDIKLYACSSCTFYHYTRKLIDKHLKEVHSGKVIIVREDGASTLVAPPAPATPSAAPTMDLKPWQCGLCKFKSMIRPEVIEHCSRLHQSKMQFKCMYCGFRTSNIENISKHQAKQHPGKPEEVFYFYYREGSIPDDANGVARWQKQSQRCESEIKTESDVPPAEPVPVLPKATPAKTASAVNLDIVKQEVVEPESHGETEDSVENLCNTFGQFCDPNGLKYKCPLCKVIIEDTKEAMQSHLYEELQYRKWGCTVCSYKAFHKPGLQQHVQTEHRYSREATEPIELKVDSRIETWVTKLLEYQTTVIQRNKENLAKQKSEILRATPGSSVNVVEKPADQPTGVTAKPNMSMAELEKLFGPFGVPSNMNYMCPKCNASFRLEEDMQEHLESELNKIRWCCTNCSDTFKTYHEAQFHCRSFHLGQSSRPVEATRDTGLRAAWVTAVLRVQKLSMNYMPVTETQPPEPPAPPTDPSPDNSLLAVRYEEKVPTPEELMKLNKKDKKTEADDEKSVTDESEKKKSSELICPYCNAVYKYESFFQVHVLKHYGLKPFTCTYCSHNDYKRMMEPHINNHHPNRAVSYIYTPVPTTPPVHDHLKNAPTTSRAATTVIDNETRIICLGCEEAMTRAESLTHYHDNVRPQFGVKGTVVYRCWACLTLHKTSQDFNTHHKQFHANEKKNSSFYKLDDEGRSLSCSACNISFASMAQYRSHQQKNHDLKSTLVESAVSDVISLDDEAGGAKRKSKDPTILPVPKRVARKSTTKLPNVLAVARKSTTKLPYDAPCDDQEYSFYGTKPSMDNLGNVTTQMSFYNTFVPVTLKKFSEVINIHPVVVVKDINDKQ